MMVSIIKYTAIYEHVNIKCSATDCVNAAQSHDDFILFYAEKLNCLWHNFLLHRNLHNNG